MKQYCRIQYVGEKVKYDRAIIKQFQALNRKIQMKWQKYKYCKVPKKAQQIDYRFTFIQQFFNFRALKTIKMQNSKPTNQQQPQPSEKQLEQSMKAIPFLSLFRFSSKFDYILMFIGSLCACGMGVVMPLFAILWGDITDSYGSQDDKVEKAKLVMLNFIYIGIGAVFTGWGMYACWMISGERQGITCRKQYFKSLLRQQISWFDSINQSELATKFSADSFAFQGAIGQKLSKLIMTLSIFVAGFIISFIKGWLMTLVCAAAVPAIGFAGYLYSKAVEKKEKQFEKDYLMAGGKVEQAITSIQTVKQLNGEKYEGDSYGQILKKTSSKSIKYGLYIGSGMGAMILATLASYSLSFWYGSNCVEGSSICPTNLNGFKTYTAGDTLAIFFNLFMAGMSFIQLPPILKNISEGRLAAARIYQIIDRIPQIKSKQNPIKPQVFFGVFVFENVSFAYPKDKSNLILDSISFEINNKQTAFCGDSGCGKSTIFQLILRYYDPTAGRITLDGVDLRQLDLEWLRSQIGYVGQQPILFSMTLRENLLFGKEQADEENINNALKQAEAYDFVQQLKDKLETFAGNTGNQLSGGQKQRLAIARALLKKPKMFLFDEATSAMDRRNEKLIQLTLKKITQNQSSITIAHRIETIANCQDIFVFEKGKIKQRGSFYNLQRFKEFREEQIGKNAGSSTESLDNENNECKKTNNFLSIESTTNATPNAVTAKNITSFDSLPLEQYVLPALTQRKQPAQKDSSVIMQKLKQQQEKKQKEELVQKYQGKIYGRLMEYIKDKKLCFSLGIFASICNGFVYPIFGIILARMLDLLLNFSKNSTTARQEANIYALIFLILGIGSFVLTLVQQIIFQSIGSSMAQQIRNQTYCKMLKMPIAWFDKPKNNSGNLCCILSSDCKKVNGLITTFIGLMCQNVTTLIVGLSIAFYFQWRTSLVALGSVPIMIISGFILESSQSGFSEKSDLCYKESIHFISESMNNIRTVSSFGNQKIILRKFEQKLKEPLGYVIKKGNISGLLYGFSQFIMYISFSLIFFLGAVFVRQYNVEVVNVFTATYAIMFASMSIGNNAIYLPDVSAAQSSAITLFEILDSQDQDQLQIKQQSPLLKNGLEGNIVFKDIEFKYEGRSEHVFTKLNLEIKKGCKIGFVGRSGCGKSTIFQLIQRFYEPTSGQILIDGKNIKDYDLHYLRECFGVVNQEPILFNDTIANNIKYNKSQLTKEQIRRAAHEANLSSLMAQERQNPIIQTSTNLAHDQLQIQKSTKGLEQNAGAKGSQLSGGQKQRIAIARTIIRRPKILLLDEATSALDSKNEQDVQQSLDKIMKYKTSISIAHRIKTIRNADLIMVFEKGEIVEQGSYNELVKNKGHFYRLQNGMSYI